MLVPQVATVSVVRRNAAGGHTRTHLARSGGCTSAACILQSVSVRPGVFVPSNVPGADPHPDNQCEGFHASASTPPVPLRRPALITWRPPLDGFCPPPRIRLAVAVAVRSSSGFGPPAPAPCRRPQSIPACGCLGARRSPGKSEITWLHRYRRPRGNRRRRYRAS